MCVVPPKVRSSRAIENLSRRLSAAPRLRLDRRATRGPSRANERRETTFALTSSVFLALATAPSPEQMLRVNPYGVASRAAAHRAGRRVVRSGVPDVVHERGRRRRRHLRGPRDPGIHGQRDHRLVLRAPHERGLPRLAPVLRGGTPRRRAEPQTRPRRWKPPARSSAADATKPSWCVTCTRRSARRRSLNSEGNSLSCASTRGPCASSPRAIRAGRTLCCTAVTRAEPSSSPTLNPPSASSRRRSRSRTTPRFQNF